MQCHAIPCRGVHEISPMKAANGGVLHHLFDFSHPQVLGGKPQRPRRNDYLSCSWPTAPLPSRLPSRPPPTNQDGPSAPSKRDSERDVDVQARARAGGDRASPSSYLSFSWPTAPLPSPLPSSRPRPINQDAPSASSKRDVGPQAGARARARGDRESHSSSSSSELDGDGGAYRRGLAFGRRLPRTLVMHGTADATVPFSQTSALADTLRKLGVPTVLRFDQGGEVMDEGFGSRASGSAVLYF